MLNICIMNINQNKKVLLDNCETSIFNCGNKNTENCVLLFQFSNNNDLLIIGGTEEFQFSFTTRAELELNPGSVSSFYNQSMRLGKCKLTCPIKQWFIHFRVK